MMSFQEKVERLYEQTYKERILRCIKDVEQEALSRGLNTGGPYDLSDEEYKWSILVYPGEEQEVGADVTITIAESVAHDGIETGINFMSDIVGYGGSIIGGIAPYNYTPEVWVDIDDDEAIEERWKIFSNAFNAVAAVDSVAAHIKEERGE